MEHVRPSGPSGAESMRRLCDYAVPSRTQEANSLHTTLSAGSRSVSLSLAQASMPRSFAAAKLIHGYSQPLLAAVTDPASCRCGDYRCGCDRPVGMMSIVCRAQQVVVIVIAAKPSSRQRTALTVIR